LIDYKREEWGSCVAEITGKRGVDAIIEMDLTANAKLIPAVLRPKAASSFTARAPKPPSRASSPRQFHPAAVLPGLSARCRQRERAVTGITQALEAGKPPIALDPPSRWPNRSRA
jgi:NADPH2:quinone reductase